MNDWIQRKTFNNNSLVTFKLLNYYLMLVFFAYETIGKINYFIKVSTCFAKINWIN